MRGIKLFLKNLYTNVLIRINKFVPNNYKVVSCDEYSLRCLKNWRAEGFAYHKKGLNAPICCLDNLEKLLKDTVDLLDNNGIEYYLTYGTYLGARRHGNIIPWDTDIDIACTAEFTVLTKVLNKSRYHVVVENNNLVRVNLSKINDLHIDIELWSMDENQSSFDDDIYVGKRSISNDKIYPLRKLYLGDNQYNCPCSDEWLFEVYGRDCLNIEARKYHLS